MFTGISPLLLPYPLHRPRLQIAWVFVVIFQWIVILDFMVLLSFGGMSIVRSFVLSQWKTHLTFRILPYLLLALEDYKFGCEPVISHLTITDTSIQYGGYFGETFQIYLFIQGFEVADLAGYSRSPSPQQCFPAPSRRPWPQVRRNVWSLRQFLSLSLSLRTSGCGQNNHKDRDL